MTRRDVNEGDVFRKGFATNALEDGATTGQVPKLAADGQMEFGEANGGSQPDGSVVPVADPVGATVDDTTYDNTWKGVGKYKTLVLPAHDSVPIAIAVEGDAFPRVVMVNPTDGFYYGDGTVNPINNGPAWWVSKDANGHFSQTIEAGEGDVQRAEFGNFDANAGYRTAFSNPIAIGGQTGGGSGPSTVSSGIGVPAIGGNVGDCYIRTDGGDGSWIYRCTVAGVAGAATWVAKV